MVVESQFVEVKFDYSKTKNHSTGEYLVASNVISGAGGRVWSIFLYPSGANPPKRSGRGEYLSLSAATFGNRPTNAAAVRAIFTAAPVRTTRTDIAGGGAAPPPSPPAVHAASEVIHHPATGDAVAADDAAFIVLFKFMRRSEVETGGFLGDDGCVRFLCGIVALAAAADRIPVPASDFGTHLGNHLLLEQNGGGGGSSSADVSFSVGGETFRAHRAILAARSPVFRAQLLGR